MLSRITVTSWAELAHGETQCRRQYAVNRAACLWAGGGQHGRLLVRRRLPYTASRHQETAVVLVHAHRLRGRGARLLRRSRGHRALWCRGSNIYGQLGTGKAHYLAIPVMVANGIPPMTSLAIESLRDCGISVSGSAWCGNGIPAAVINEDGVASLSMGTAHSCAVKLDGSAWCCGRTRRAGWVT